MMKLAIVHGFQKIADELSQQFNALEEKVDESEAVRKDKSRIEGSGGLCSYPIGV